VWTLAVPNDPGPPARILKPRKPRAYQREALDAYWKCRDSHRGVLFEIFTSAGKTYLASEIARDLGTQGKRTLFLCNRRVLGYQSLEELAAGTGYEWELEQAENRADRNGRAPVVALVQTMSGERLLSWPRDAFDQIIADEVHRLMGPVYRKVFEHFSGAKILGLTATPDGAKSYGDLFTHTAYSMDLIEAIDKAWAVPFRFRYFTADVDLDSIDWKRSKEGGDFDLGQLDENIAGIASQIRKAYFDYCDGPTLIRCPGIKSVIATTDAINEIQPGRARMIYGEMDDRDKEANISGYKEGAFPALVSCQMIGEGFDAPATRFLLNARPTTKRHDAVQWWGRGARLVNREIGAIEDMDERRSAIASSIKPHCLAIELNAKCRHDIVSPFTVFGGAFSDEVQKKAKKKRPSTEFSVQDVMSRVAEEIDRRKARAAAAAAAKVNLKEHQPEEPPPRLTSAGEHALEPWQEKKLREFGIPFDDQTTKAKATKLIRGEFLCRKKGLCDYRQREFLARWVGIQKPWGTSVETGKRLTDAWRANGKRRLTSGQIAEALGGST
jgi:superfamily II DNA or RNA helicase